MDAVVMHTVEVLCFCDDIEHCRMERYIADVRMAEAENAELREREARLSRLPGLRQAVIRDRRLRGALDGFVVG